MKYFVHNCIAILLCINFSIGYGQQAVPEGGKYLWEQWEKDSFTLPYRILYPLDFDPTGNYPLILFLHGRGERGSDNEKQLIHGSRLFLDSLSRYPAIVVFPQCPESDYWANVQRVETPGRLHLNFLFAGQATQSLEWVISLMEELLAKPWTDDDRFYVTGLSMGGMGAFELSWRMADRIAACLPVCGGGDVTRASEMSKIPFWIFHGVRDNVVNPNHSIRMLTALQKAGGRAKITLFPEANHNSWDPAFADPEFLSWMFSQKRSR